MFNNPKLMKDFSLRIERLPYDKFGLDERIRKICTHLPSKRQYVTVGFSSECDKQIKKWIEKNFIAKEN